MTLRFNRNILNSVSNKQLPNLILLTVGSVHNSHQFIKFLLRVVTALESITTLTTHQNMSLIIIMTYITKKQTTPVTEQSSSSTCSLCPNFQDFQEQNGRGWCALFDRMAKQHHPRTNDCDSTLSLYPENIELPEEDLPYSEFEAENIVKIIDSEEHHTEWAKFIVVAKKLNTERYRSTESYLTEPQWYYQLAAIPYEPTYPHSRTSQPFWVAETDICHFDQSHLIETETDVF